MKAAHQPLVWVRRSQPELVRRLHVAGSSVSSPGPCALGKAAGDAPLLGTPGQSHALTHPAWVVQDPSAMLRLPWVL